MTYRPLPVRLVVVVAVVVALFVAGPASGEPPQISAKRAEAQRVLEQIQELDGELGQTIEAYNAANVELDRIRGARAVNSRHLKLARGNLKVAQGALAQRLAALYRGEEGDSTLAILLGSRSFGDFLGRLDAVDRVANQDTQVLGEIDRFKSEVETRAVNLKRAQKRQQSVVAERAAARQRVEAGLAERQRLLNSIRGEIEHLQAEERERQAELRRQAVARIAAQRAAAARAAEAPETETEAIPSTSAPIVGAAAMTPSGYTVAPPSRYGGAVAIAMQYLGVPYVWGGESPSGFDCSGLVVYVWRQLGVELPHYTGSLWQLGTPVSRDQLEPGDLVFFNGLGHMGIYIGGGQMIHAPRTGDVVKISSINEGWYLSTWYGARRL